MGPIFLFWSFPSSPTIMIVWQDVLTHKELEAPRHVYWDAFTDTKGKDVDPNDVLALAKKLVAIEKPADDEVLSYLRALHYVSRERHACAHLDSESFFKSLFPYASPVKLMHRDDVAFEAFCTLCNILNHFHSHINLFSYTFLDGLFDQLDTCPLEPTKEEFANEQGFYSLMCLCIVFCTSGDYFAETNLLTTLQYRTYLDYQISKYLPPRDTPTSSWSPPYFFVYLLATAVNMVRKQNEYMQSFFIPALYAFHAMEVGSPCLLTPPLMYTLTLLVLVRPYVPDEEKDHSPPLIEIMDKLAHITASLIDRYLCDSEQETEKLLEQDGVLGTFEGMVSPCVAYLSTLLSILPVLIEVAEKHFFEKQGDEERPTKPRSPKFSRFFCSAAYPMLGRYFGDMMLLLSDGNMDFLLKRFDMETCAAVIHEQHKRMQSTLKDLNGEEGKKPLAEVTVHESGEHVPGSMSLEELVDSIRELEKEGKTLLDAKEEDLKEEKVLDGIDQRILELQHQDTLSEDEAKELLTLSQIKEAVEKEVKRITES